MWHLPRNSSPVSYQLLEISSRLITRPEYRQQIMQPLPVVLHLSCFQIVSIRNQLMELVKCAIVTADQHNLPLISVLQLNNLNILSLNTSNYESTSRAVVELHPTNALAIDFSNSIFDEKYTTRVSLK